MGSKKLACMDCGKQYTEGRPGYRVVAGGEIACKNLEACGERVFARHGGAIYDYLEGLSRQEQVWRACQHCGLPVRRAPADGFTAQLVGGQMEYAADVSHCRFCGMPSYWKPGEDMEDQRAQWLLEIETAIAAFTGSMVELIRTLQGQTVAEPTQDQNPDPDPEGLGEQDLEDEQQRDYNAMIGDSLQGWNTGRD